MRVPVSIVTGFLGAGKTTLVKRLLDTPHGPRTGVILNEIGEAGIDSGFELQSAFVELKDRCACCVQSADLRGAVEDVLARAPVERIVLETTGLADPLPIVWRLQTPELAPRVRVEALVTVVDPTGHAAYASAEWQAQVHAADIISVSKQDVASGLEIAGLLHQVRGESPHARLVAPALLPDALLDGDLDLDGRALPSFAPLIARHSDWQGVVTASDRTHLLSAVEDWLEALPDDVFRAKGIVKTEQGYIAFQRVAGRTDVDLEAPRPAHGQSRVAVFGRRIDTRGLQSGFLATAGAS